MRRRDLSSLGRTISLWLVGGICLSVAVLAWFGYKAARELRRSSETLEQRRAEQTADLFVRALVRDMRGVESGVLRGVHLDHDALREPNELSDVVASAFARYPYPELFFAWRGSDDASAAVFFIRADRRPNWLPSGRGPSRFPVTIVKDEAVARKLMDLAAPDVAHGQRFSVGETAIGGDTYQFVARLIYRTAGRPDLEHVLGFMVNLRWVREAYFSELTEVLGRIAAAGTGMTTAIFDEQGSLIAGTSTAASDGPVAVRRLRPVFFDPSLVALKPPDDVPQQHWTIRVAAAREAAGALGMRGSDQTILAMTSAAVVLGVGLLLTARALRASADLAKLRCDFVASATHELKTPLTTIRVVGETLSRGRLQDAAGIRDYAQLVDQEAKRLTRVVDNMLAYSRVTDVSDVYSFEPLALIDLIEDVLRDFQPQFTHRRFEVCVDVPPDLPPIRGDRTALGLVFDNLVDNALHYSADGGSLGVRARPDGRSVRVEVTDRGIGIPSGELAAVVRPFVRGRHAGTKGSGLGLAIASRVIRDHGGDLRIVSSVGAGTTVQVALPVMRDS
jgi:signal transduction histidine kinase